MPPTRERRRELAAAAAKRRAELGDDDKCLNGAHHGKATHGRRCEWCALVNSRGLATVLELEARGDAPQRPPGYNPKPHRHTAESARIEANARNSARRHAYVERRVCIRAARHGKATHGSMCDWCAFVNLNGVERALELEAEGCAPRRPPGYKPRSSKATPIETDDDDWLR